jgi:hypothetical protein
MSTLSVESRRGGPAGFGRRVGWWFAAVALAAALATGAAQALELNVADVEIAPDQTVAIPVRAIDAKGLAALQMQLTFDGEALEVTEVSAGPALPNALVDFKPTKGFCTVAFASSDPVAADGDLLIVKMRRKAGANGGSIVLPENVRAWSGDGDQAIQVSAHPGHVAPLPQSPSVEGRSFDWRYLAGALAAIVVVAVGAALMLARRGRAKASARPALEKTAPAQSPPKPGAGPHFCAACGAPLTEDANYCPNCGVKIARA